MIIGADGWLDEVRRIDSPNFDARPPGSSIELIVIHTSACGSGGGHIERLFTNALDVSADPFFAQIVGARVSAHILIDRDGTTAQFVSFTQRAWHAGTSVFNGRTHCNDFSIGIELEGTDFEPFADAQYRSLNLLIDAILTVSIKAVLRPRRHRA